MQAEQGRPEVTLTASSLPIAPGPALPDAPRRRPSGLLLLPLLALVLAFSTGRTPPPPPAGPTLDAELVLLGERVSTSQSGVLVLPVELRNEGDALQVQRIAPYGFPLRAEPSVQGPQQVPAGERGRFVLIVTPDCRALGAGPTGLLELSLLARVASGEASGNLILQLTDDALVRERVAGLCGERPTGPRSRAAA